MRGASPRLLAASSIHSDGDEIDGLQIEEGRVDYGHNRTAVFIDGAFDNVTVTNSIIDQVVAHNDGTSPQAILTTYGPILITSRSATISSPTGTRACT